MSPVYESALACTQGAGDPRTIPGIVRIRLLPLALPVDNSTHPATSSEALLARALDGDQGDIRALVRVLTPAIQSAVARVLLRAPRRGRDIREAVADLTQDVFQSLFDDNARALRAWDPAAGRTLKGYVGMLAERRSIDTLRSRRRSPYTEEPSEAAALERPTSGTPEAYAADRESLAALTERLEQSLSAQGLRVFRMLFCEEASPDAVAQALGISRQAVYMWRSRIRDTARALAGDLDAMREGA